MIWTDLPPLNALKAFSAVAETGSYSKAGAALNVTHAAVLQQVRILEKHLGVPLAVRSGRGVELTSEGAALAHDLAIGFARIRRGVEGATDAGAVRPVHVTMSPVFAVKWLMPRMVDFQARHPEITLLLNPTGQIMELKPGGIDVAIRYSPFDRLKEDMDVLLEIDLAVVGVPSFKDHYKISKPADLIHLPWLQELGTNEVTDWLSRHDVTLERPLMISHMPGNLIMDAVNQGDGITYTARQWVEPELRKGALVELWPEEDRGAFYIHRRPGELRRPVRIFLQWLKQQVAA